MKKLLPIVGAALIAACVLLLFYGALHLFAYYRVLDGSAALYLRLRRSAFVGLVAGAVCAALGGVCLAVRAGMRRAGALPGNRQETRAQKKRSARAKAAAGPAFSAGPTDVTPENRRSGRDPGRRTNE